MRAGLAMESNLEEVLPTAITHFFGVKRNESN